LDPTKRPSNKNLAIVMAVCEKESATEQRRALVADIVANEQVMEWITNGGNDIIEEMYFHEGEDCFQERKLVNSSNTYTQSPCVCCLINFIFGYHFVVSSCFDHRHSHPRVSKATV